MESHKDSFDMPSPDILPLQKHITFGSFNPVQPSSAIKETSSNNLHRLFNSDYKMEIKNP